MYAIFEVADRIEIGVYCAATGQRRLVRRCCFKRWKGKTRSKGEAEEVAYAADLCH
jgi:hypothetical protein